LKINRGGNVALDYRLPDVHGQAAIFWVNKPKPFLIIQTYQAAGEENEGDRRGRATAGLMFRSETGPTLKLPFHGSYPNRLAAIPGMQMHRRRFRLFIEEEHPSRKFPFICIHSWRFLS
jgi:hypothetical protein